MSKIITLVSPGKLALINGAIAGVSFSTSFVLKSERGNMDTKKLAVGTAAAMGLGAVLGFVVGKIIAPKKAKTALGTISENIDAIVDQVKSTALAEEAEAIIPVVAVPQGDQQ